MYNYIIKKNIVFLMILIIVLSITGCEQKISKEDNLLEYKESADSINNLSNSKSKNNIIKNPRKKINNDQDTLEMKVKENCIKAKIQSLENYQTVLDYLDNIENIYSIYLDLCNTNISIYLDELLRNQTIGYLDIKNGGSICIKDQTFLKTSNTYSIKLHYVFEIQKNLFDGFNGLEICVQLDNQYTGILPTIDLLNNINCENIALKWEGNGQLNGMDTYWEYFYSVLPKEEQYLKGVYQTKQEQVIYTSYEFCKEDSEETSKIFIFIKDIGRKKDVQILEISKPQLTNISRHDGKRFYLRDINFDGYQDLIFVGDNDNIKLFYQCICFLWNEKEQLYKLCETAPKNFKYIDEKQRRLLYNTSGSAFEDTYYIYKYNGNLFEEEKLDVLLPQTNSETITWHYIKDGQLQKKLEVTPNKESNSYTVIFYEKENTQYELLIENISIWDIGRKYFPEFDFYNLG